MKPLLLKPIGDKTIWGSNRMSKLRGCNENIGTWWEVSAHPYCSNEVINLDKKITLQQVIEKNPDDILGPGYTLHEMLRLAYLDSQDALSIQVHPDDVYAREYANDFGKYESWYILDALPGASLVAGTNISNQKVIKEALKNDSLDLYLQKWSVKKGDYIIIPQGMIHALGKGILALEIGTNSNTTYRFYDYKRKDSNGNYRHLHIKESFDVTDFSKQPIFVEAKNETRRLTDGPYFVVDELYLKEDMTITMDKSYCIISNIDSSNCIIQWQDEVIELNAYASLFVPYSAKIITIKKGGHVLYSQPKKENN